MNTILVVRLTIAAIGVLVWAYGAREDHQMARLIGIGILAVALLVRFAGPRLPRGEEEGEGE